MVVDIKTVMSSSRGELSEYVKTLSVPAVLLDEKLKIISKNSEAATTVRGLRKGISVKKFVSSADFAKLAEIEMGQSVYAEFLCDGMCYGATVVGGFDFRLAVLRPLDSGIRCSISSLYEKISGYDLKINAPETEILSENSFTRAMSAFFLHKLDELSAVRELPFFNAAAVVKSIFGELSRFSRRKYEKIHASVSSDELVISGSAHDFALFVGLLLAYCVDICAEERFVFEASSLGNEAIFRVAVNTDLSFGEMRRFTGNVNMDDELSFRLYMLRLLADGNLWEFRSGQDYEGRLTFTLRTLLTTPFGTPCLRDVSNEKLRELIRLLFA